MKKILVTGGTGRFGKLIKKLKLNYNLHFPEKSQFNILKKKQMENFIKKTKPNILIHLAGLSRPMSDHDLKISKSINLNIIGTANIVNLCYKFNIKLIYFSTHYVYPGIKGNYKETSPLLPFNNYAWSKLGGESAVHLYKNSLILRVCMTERPFVHKKAFSNVKTSFLYQEDVAKILFKLLNKKGVINIGGKSKLIYDFVKKENPKVKKYFLKKNKFNLIPKDSSLNVKKLKKILNKNK